MDVERTIEFILQAQAKAEANLQNLSSTVGQLSTAMSQTNRQQLQLAESLNRVVNIVGEIAEAQRRSEEEFRRFQEESRRAEEENRRAHQRYDLAHQETEERFNALIKMMDEWIRKQNGAS